MAEGIKEVNDNFCAKAHCNTLKNGESRSFLTAFLILTALFIIRVVVLGVIFGYGFLPVYYLYFPLMAILQVTLIIVEAVILFRKTGLFVLIMLLHLLIFCPILGFIAFIPWAIVGLIIYGVIYET